MFVLSMLGSCTLYMDDLALPEEQIGMDEPYTKEMPDGGHITYQYNEGVKVITANVEDYIHHVDADTVLYFMDNTPPEYIPSDGEMLSSICCPTLPQGINNRVLRVEERNGFIVVTTTPCRVDEVYKVLDAEYSVDVRIPSCVGLDSLTLDSLGINIDELKYTYWGPYEEVYPEAKARRMARRKAEGDGLLGLFGFEAPELLNEKDISLVETEMSIWHIDTRHNFNLLPKSNWDQVQKATKSLNPLPIFLRTQGRFVLNGKLDIRVVLNPMLSTQIKVTIQPAFHFLLEVGFGMGGGVSSTREFEFDLTEDEAHNDSILASVRRQVESSGMDGKLVADALKKLPKAVREIGGKIKIPEINIPIPVVTPAVTAVIKPRFSINFDWAVGGRYEKYTNFRPIIGEIHLQQVPQLGFPFFNIVTSKFDVTTGDEVASPDATLTAFGQFNAYVTAGLGMGFSLCKVVDVNFYNDLELRLTGEISNTSTPVGKNEQCYDPAHNALTLSLYDIPGLEFSVAGLNIPPWELSRFTLWSTSWNIKPNVSGLTFSDFSYADGKRLESVTATLPFTTNGWFDEYRLGATPILCIRPHDQKDNKDDIIVRARAVGPMIEDNAEYHFDCTFPTDKDYLGFDVYPGIEEANGQRNYIYGVDTTIPGTTDGALLEIHSQKQTYGHPWDYFSRDLRYKMADNAGISHMEATKYDVYGAKFDFKLFGAYNIKEWGFQVKLYVDNDDLGFSSSEAVATKNVCVQKGAAIKSGTKKMMLYFLDNYLKPKEGERYNMRIQPYYVTHDGEKHYAHYRTVKLNFWDDMASAKKVEKDVANSDADIIQLK